MLEENEIRLAEECLSMALRHGAQKCRITLSKSIEDIVATLDGEIDKVTGCADRSISIVLFVDGRYGSFSTNKLEEASLNSFIAKAVDMVRMLAEDGCYDLPNSERCCKNAVSGMEMGIFDPARKELTAQDRCRMALDAALTGTEGYSIVSEEGEYSDMEYDTFVADTDGLRCRHTETSFDYGVDMTVEDGKGNRYNEYWWTSSPFLKDFDASQCGRIAAERAAAQEGGKAVRSGKYNMVVDSEMASRMVSPILGALKGYNIQQNNSFLTGKLGMKVFPEGMTLVDRPHIMGQTGSKLFDSEGVATKDAPIIEKGVIKQYFINTYIGRKMQMAPTVEEATRPVLCGWPKAGLDRDDLLKTCGDGIYVTEFNGGNSNSATGDFSYGIRGFLFKNGKIVKPVSGMLVTGNFLKLWNGLLAVADDARPCMSKLIPTLAFSNVDFSGE